MRKLLILICLFATIGIARAQRKDKPNVILIVMDDMGYGDTEPYGMTGIATPHFNLLAKQGMRFTHYNVAEPICTASRAGILTGCYPKRVGMSGALAPNSKMALNPDEQTIASILKDNGYTTGMLGKWHLGGKPPYWPLHYGFDSYFGLPYSHDMSPMGSTGHRVVNPKNMGPGHPFLPLIEGDKIVDSISTMEQASQLTTMMTDKATAFIKQNKSKPFFLYLAHPLPHVPLAVSSKFKGKSGDMGIFGDVIMELDWSLGQIMETLDKEKLADNTLLIVTSDNGPWLTFGSNAGSPGGFREGKMTTYDGGTRVPCYMRWPGKIEAGSVNSKLMVSIDLLPTIAAATGSQLPRKKIDGINFLPLLENKTQVPPREVFYYYYNRDDLQAVRYKNWKLVLPHKSLTNTMPGKGDMAGKTAMIDVPLALFDLAHDPGERYDVQENYPEMVAKIQTLAQKAREDLGDDLTGVKGTGVRPSAQIR